MGDSTFRAEEDNSASGAKRKPDSASGAKRSDETPAKGDIKASLRRLAGPDPETTIELAADATEDLGVAAQFVGSIGLDRLAAAIEATGDETYEARGRRALGAFRRFQRAAAGEFGSEADRSGGGYESDNDRSTKSNGPDSDHFHRGRGTHLRRDGERPPQ